MGAVSDAFYEKVLEGIGAPQTEENLRACHAWEIAEGGTARFNPFNTTQSESGDTHYNSFGPNQQYHVRNYPSLQTGIKATVETLRNGHYQGILAAFRRGSDGAAVCTAVDGSVWGTHGAHTVYLRLYGRSTPPAHRVLHVTDPLMHGSDVRQVQERLIHLGFNCGPTRDDGWYGKRTSSAVGNFQRAKHLSVNGNVDTRTRIALGLGA